ncbi:hypothetical protein ISM_05985 [Roseovarius nubinhibens ISM]|uniref:Uncharacterized protein n=1 Tax=Roseovarius nubinhibens (strain ATCC BAA-591 / DSM 15170 / ISM) TaxID=89187 RepID=A3SKD9_ROSNI|nr:hypothetical protein ISM_05985 [Roseovarius nubinhibens ISM]
MRPFSIKATRSATDNTASTRCSTSRIATPSARSLTITCRIASIIEGCNPSVGSSSNSALGRRHSARAVASICCSPPDRVCAFCPIRSRSRGNSSRTSSSTSRPLPRVMRPTSRFCATVSPAKSRRPCGI